MLYPLSYRGRTSVRRRQRASSSSVSRWCSCFRCGPDARSRIPYSEVVPESYGKRQRSTAKAKKIAAREERRLERKQRDADRAAGLIEPGTPIEANEPDEFGALPAEVADAEETEKASPSESA